MVVQGLSASGRPSRSSKSWLFLPFFVCLSVRFTTCLYFLNKEPVSWSMKTESEVSVCRGERGEPSPWLTGACFLPVGSGCLRAAPSPGGAHPPAHILREDCCAGSGWGCLSLPLIHQMLAERLWVAVPGRGVVWGSEGIQVSRAEETGPGDSLFLIIMAIL